MSPQIAASLLLMSLPLPTMPAPPAVVTATDYQAENCVVSQGVVESNHAGYTGSGFVNTDNVTGSWIECTVSGPATTLSVRYANGTTTNRPMSFPAGLINFPGTGAWTTWATATVPINLGSGSQTLRLTSTTANGGPNLDRISIDNAVNDINVSTSTELRNALSTVQPGQTIRLAPGTYHGSFISQRAGTASAPITLSGPREAVLVNDGPSGTAPACPTPTPGWDPGYGLWLANAPYWNLTGFTVAESKKGLVLDNSHHVVIDGLFVHHVDDEAVHFRRSSADGVIRNSRIESTGLVQPGFGEGVYLGSANSNWSCHGNSGGIDRSDRVQVSGNTIGPSVTAEHIDVKEGTQGGVIRGNTFRGTGISGQNSGDSWVDVKGNNYLLEQNTGTFAPPGTFANGYETHNPVSGYGCGNVWRSNQSDLGGVGAYAIRITSTSACSANPNVVYASNTVTNARTGLTNIPVTP